MCHITQLTAASVIKQTDPACYNPAFMSISGILEAYAKEAPSPQQALDIFKGEWASAFPAPFDDLEAGSLPLFMDERAVWALDTLGGCSGQNVLELGPLEGGHTYRLHQYGAASITAIEANPRAYLKCLIAKEILGLPRAKFLFGDFIEFLNSDPTQYGLIFSAGVLYHMRDPVGLIKLLSEHTKRLYMWTHYYDDEIIQASPYLSYRYTKQEAAETAGYRYTLNRQDYLHSLEVLGYSGGTAEYSNWLTRSDLLGALRHFGFTEIQISDEHPDHFHGPCFNLVAIQS